VGRQAVPVDHLKKLCTECSVYVPMQKRQKLDAKSVKGYLAGYYVYKDGYRVNVPDHDNVITSRDVILKEEQPSSTEEVDSSNEVSQVVD